MSEGVPQEAAIPEKTQSHEGLSDKEINFRRLESAREAERDARIRAEMQAEQMRNELREIKQMLQPKESDPLAEVEDYVDPARLRAKLEKERSHFKKEAKEIAEKTYGDLRKKEYQENYLERLKSQFSDYDQVMNEANIVNLEKVDPVFLETAMDVSDEYKRRLSTYKKIKSMQSMKAATEQMSIKEKVEENTRNPYYIAPSTGTPSAVEFDTRSKAAREQAYEKLKSAQRRPILGNGPAQAQ
jgi:hypothetical protein